MFSVDLSHGRTRVYANLDMAMAKGREYVDAILGDRLFYINPPPRNHCEIVQRAMDDGWEITESKKKGAWKYEITYRLYHSHRLWVTVQEWTVHKGV